MEIKHCLEHSHEAVPDLVESDIDSEVDDSLSTDPVIKRGGDYRDFWGDHLLNKREEPKLPTFEPMNSPIQSPEQALSISPSQAPKKVGDANRCNSSDGKSCRLHQQYQVSLRNTQIPPGVHHMHHLW